MTRLLHTGDTHLGYRQYHRGTRREDFLRSFQQVAEDAIETNVDAVVHAGDLFHDRQPTLEDVMGAIGVLRVLDTADIPFLGIVGNHESKRNRQWLDLFAEMGLAQRLDDEPTVVGSVALYGLDFVPRSRREDYSYEFHDQPPNTAATALVSHGLFEPFEHGDWDTHALLTESPVEFDVLLLGDDHTPRTKQLEEPYETWLTYCGSTERTSVSERDERGYNLVHFEDGVDIRRRGLDTREFRFVDVDLQDGEGTVEIKRRLDEYDLGEAVVIVTIDGTGNDVTPAEIESYADEKGALLARVNDRRQLDHDQSPDVSFADPDQAVSARIQELGLSEVARELDEMIRTDSIANSNLADTAQSRVNTLIEEEGGNRFEPAPAEDTGQVDDNQRNDVTDNSTDGAVDPSPTRSDQLADQTADGEPSTEVPAESSTAATAQTDDQSANDPNTDDNRPDDQPTINEFT